VLFDDILLFQRIDGQQIARVSVHVEPRAIVYELERRWRDLARSKGLSFRVHVAPDVPNVVATDGDALRTLLRHLVSNAVKFTERGGVALSVRALEATGDTASLRIDVTDTGVGIDPGLLPHLFRSFEQGQPFSTCTHGGLGLGLAIASRLAAYLGATLDVDSAPAEGTEFFLTLPVTVVTAAGASHAVPESTAPVQALRVLLVEDNAVNQALGVALLHREGHRVRVVSNGREAVMAVQREVFDLVLMDIQMPEMDGYEATIRIRALDASLNRHTPIVALTAHGHTFEQRRCFAVGMDDVVSKPLNHATLQRISSHGLARHAEHPCRPSHSPSDTPVDVASLRARVAGRCDVLQRLVEAFREQHPLQRAALHGAALRGNAPEVRAIAHKMIGSLSCFSANDAVARAREIERRAAASDLSDIHLELEGFDRAVESLEAVLVDLSTHGFREAPAP
jgi:hypothetical protein